jgi:hypothetical protein
MPKLERTKYQSTFKFKIDDKECYVNIGNYRQMYQKLWKKCDKSDEMDQLTEDKLRDCIVYMYKHKEIEYVDVYDIDEHE